MTKKQLSIRAVVVIGILILLVFVGCALYRFGLQNGQKMPASLNSDSALILKTYTSPSGFSFQYPEGNGVGERTDLTDPNTKIILVYELDPNGRAEETPPRMQITVHAKQSVTFALWEGIPWSGFSIVTGSFSFAKK